MNRYLPKGVLKVVRYDDDSLSLSCPLCQHREDNGITKLIQLLFVEIKEVCEFAVGVHERQLMQFHVDSRVPG